MKRRWRSVVAAFAAVAALGNLTGVTTYAADSVSITNVSYDPTRELYEQYNKIFPEHWKNPIIKYSKNTGKKKQARMLRSRSPMVVPASRHLRLPTDWKQMW